MRIKSYLLLLITVTFQLSAQEPTTRKDSLKGSLRIERTCYDVLRYDLNVKVTPSKKFIVGYNEITFKIVSNTKKIQLDLFDNMQIDSIVFNSKKLKYKREFDAVFVNFGKELTADSQNILRFYYSGNPIIAKRAPWDGGFVYNNDSSG